MTAIKTSLGRTRTEHSCGPHARFKAHLRGRSRSVRRGSGDGGDGDGCGEEERREIGSGRYILRDRSGPGRVGPALPRYLIWPLSEPRVAVFWPGIVLRGFTFISILITRSLGSRFGTRYPSSLVYVYLALSLSFLPSLAPSFPLLPLTRLSFSFSTIGSAQRALKFRASSVSQLSPLY